MTSVTINSAGTGYARGDTVTFTDPMGTETITITVDTLDVVQSVLNSGNLSLNKLIYPMSPGLVKNVFPHLPLFGAAPATSLPETPNIIGSSVTLNSTSGGVGIETDAFSITGAELTGNWASLDTSLLEAMSSTTWEDRIGVAYTLYEFTGSGSATIMNQATQDFSAGGWSEVAIDSVTETSRAVDQLVDLTQNVSTVLVQFTRDEFGLYRYTGTTAVDVNLSREDYLTGPWTRLIAVNEVDDSVYSDIGNQITVPAGEFVADLRSVEYFAFKLTDDVDIQDQVSGPLPITVNSGGDVSLQVPDDMRILSITAAGNVRLQAGGSIIDTDIVPGSESTTAPVITATGNLLLQSLGGTIGVGGADGDSPLRVDLSGGSNTGRLTAEVNTGDLFLEQVGTTADLVVSRIDVPSGFVDIRVLDGNMEIGTVEAGDSIYLEASVNIVDTFDDANAPVINITTLAPSPAGDVNLVAVTGDIGTSSNPIDVSIGSADLFATAANDIFIHSVIDLNVNSVTSTSGDVTLDVDGNVFVDLITATVGTVTLITEKAIIDRRNATEGVVGPNIVADKTILIAQPLDTTVYNIGSSSNFFETQVNALEARAYTGGIWLDNTGNLVLGHSDRAEATGVQAAGDIVMRAHSSIDINEPIHSDGDLIQKLATTDINVNAAITSAGGRCNCWPTTTSISA